MNTKKLLNTALNGLDYLGFQLDQFGITGRINRHNVAAFLMAEQHHLEGEWDSLQARFDRRKADFEALVESAENRASRLLAPISRLHGRAA